jgi:hypothetical protein
MTCLQSARFPEETCLIVGVIGMFVVGVGALYGTAIAVAAKSNQETTEILIMIVVLENKTNVLL